MTQILARSVLALFATSSLALGASTASASPAVRATPAVMRDGADTPQLILAATHHRKHHASAKGAAHKKTAHRKGHGKGRHHAAEAADESDAGAPGANGHISEVASAGETYKVKKGDTLAKVADKLGVEVAELKKLNKIKGTSIRAGQVLKGPGSTEKAYVAARGDTVAAVAARFGVTAKALKSQNGLGRRVASLKSGQLLTLPEGARDHGAPKAETESTPSRRLRGRLAAPAEEEAPLPSAGADRAVMGRVTEVPGPMRSYRTKRGDTLEKVADRLGVSVSQLKKQNHLRSSHLRRGQVLRAPGGMVKAYVVGPSDTTYGIARRFGVTIEALRAANGMGRRGTIHTGERLRLPSGWRDHGPGAGQAPNPLPPEGPIFNRPPVVPIPTGPRTYTPPATTPGTGPAFAPTSAPPPSDAQISELGRGKFIWPVQGQILSEFGPKAGVQEGAGINIQANAGDPVRAAAAGEVAYAGDQLPGYGNLVLITHPDGWVTAYSHLSKVEVKMKQKVTQGQEIGQAGSTGGVAQPQVHFEVRYYPNPQDRAKPVDPRLVLPK